MGRAALHRPHSNRSGCRRHAEADRRHRLRRARSVAGNAAGGRADRIWARPATSAHLDGPTAKGEVSTRSWLTRSDRAARSVVPSIAQADRPSDRAGFEAVAARLSRMTPRSAAGLRLCYHNHAFEFGQDRNGTRWLDVLMRGTAEAGLLLQLDVFWASIAGRTQSLFSASTRPRRVAAPQGQGPQRGDQPGGVRLADGLRRSRRRGAGLPRHPRARRARRECGTTSSSRTRRPAIRSRA